MRAVCREANPPFVTLCNSLHQRPSIARDARGMKTATVCTVEDLSTVTAIYKKQTTLLETQLFS